MDERASELATQYINGNRKGACTEILAGPNPAVMAAKVAQIAAGMPATMSCSEFIRILASVTENDTTIQYNGEPTDDRDEGGVKRACDRGMD